jgi:hypothetical protein
LTSTLRRTLAYSKKMQQKMKGAGGQGEAADREADFSTTLLTIKL